jgi:hypothetical protein
MSYHTMATERLSRKTHKIIDIAVSLDRAELEELAFTGWLLDRVIERVSKAGHGYLTYTFIRQSEVASA